MNCLNKAKIQEYIDNELGDAEHTLITSHLNSCQECKKLHLELLEDIRLIDAALGIFKIEPRHIPTTEIYTSHQKKAVFRIPVFIKATAAILLIVISISFILSQYHKSENIEAAKIVVNSFINDTDPNEQWHDNQILLTISNDKNEILFSFIMDSDDDYQ